MKRTHRKLQSLALALCCWPAIALSANQAVTIHVEGMTCPLCVTAINKALRSLPEVQRAKTSLTRNEAVVVVPEGYATAHLLSAIEETGYKGVIRSVQATDE